MDCKKTASKLKEIPNIHIQTHLAYRQKFLIISVSKKKVIAKDWNSFLYNGDFFFLHINFSVDFLLLLLGEIWFCSLNGVNEVPHITKSGKVVKLAFMYELLQKNWYA